MKAPTLEAENVFKIASAYHRVREFLESQGWEFEGRDEEMDLFRNKKTGAQLWIEDISENFPVTFLMGEINLPEFAAIARRLTPEIKLLEVDSSWEGRPTTIFVAMTRSQVRDMFGRGTKVRPLPAPRVASQT